MKKTQKNKYISSNESFYDEDKQLYYAYLGLNKADMPLIATYYGTNPSIAIKAANEAAKMLNRKLIETHHD